MAKSINITLITGNLNKVKEIKNHFEEQNLNINLIHSNIETMEIQADSLEEVAIFKVKSVKNKVNGSYFIEDAGFFVDDKLNGFPGVYSSYVMKVLGNEAILKLMEKSVKRKSKFQAVIALYYEPDDEIHIFKGEVLGSVSQKIRGAQGFGFDPIFIPDELPEKTFAEISADEKNNISHRARAMDKMIEFLKDKMI